MRQGPRPLGMVGAVLLAALCAGGNCTVEVSSDHDCDAFDHDPHDGCDCPQDAAPPPWVFAFVAVDPDGTVRQGFAWVEPGSAR